MLPQCIILGAIERQIDLIAVTDHNAADNVPVTVALGDQFGIWVIPAMEIETREEIHCLCYFPDLSTLQVCAAALDTRLPRLPLDESIWGEEWVVNEEGIVIQKKEHLLTRSLDMSIEEACELVNGHGGVMIPSHVDRTAYSILQVLGFIPPDLIFPALEVSRSTDTAVARDRFFLGSTTLIRSSDAHRLDDIGTATTEFVMDCLSWDEFLLALAGQSGRRTLA